MSLHSHKDLVTPLTRSDPIRSAEPNSELQGLKATVDKANEILRSASPLLTDGIADADALESWVKMVGGKLEMGDSEMKRIGDKLACASSPSVLPHS